MRQVILLIIMIVIAFPSQSEKYVWAYDYKKLEKEANKGDAYSQMWMGRTFEEGRFDITPYERKAFQWYLKAVKLRDPDASKIQE